MPGRGNRSVFQAAAQDDVLAPECLERQVALLESDTGHHIAWFFCARNIVDAKTMS